MENFKIILLEGDGIGSEVLEQAVGVLEFVAEKENLKLSLEKALVGGAAYDELGRPDPDETIDLCKSAQAVLLGAVGGPKWDSLARDKRPEQGLLRLRYDLGLFANLRPAKIYAPLVDASALKKEVLLGTDVMVIRELTGGAYFGKPRGVEKTAKGRRAFNNMVYEEYEIQRIAKVAFEIARLRGKKLCSVDKANVLEVSGLWREIVMEVAHDYSDVELSHLYIDNAVMQVIREPKQFDTLVTENMFGDILSDACAMITGSIGLLPSASIGKKYSLYEPVHGSAPDIAGMDRANPLATILSVAMMFHYTFQMPEANLQIEKAVSAVLENYRTADIKEDGKKTVGCKEMGDLVLSELRHCYRVMHWASELYAPLFAKWKKEHPNRFPTIRAKNHS